MKKSDSKYFTETKRQFKALMTTDEDRERLAATLALAYLKAYKCGSPVVTI
jgi:hypothetical protein